MGRKKGAKKKNENTQTATSENANAEQESSNGQANGEQNSNQAPNVRTRSDVSVSLGAEDFPSLEFTVQRGRRKQKQKIDVKQDLQQSSSKKLEPLQHDGSCLQKSKKSSEAVAIPSSQEENFPTTSTKPIKKPSSPTGNQKMMDFTEGNQNEFTSTEVVSVKEDFPSLQDPTQDCTQQLISPLKKQLHISSGESTEDCLTNEKEQVEKQDLPITDVPCVKNSSKSDRKSKKKPQQVPLQYSISDEVSSIIHPQQKSSLTSISPSATEYGDFELTIPYRRGKGGTLGRPIMVETNHLALTFQKLGKAVHYDVTITPDQPKKLLREVMYEYQKKYYRDRYPAFDGTKNLYSSKELPFGLIHCGEVTVLEGTRSKSFSVVIKFANFVELSPLQKYVNSKTSGYQHLTTPQEVIQCLDVVLRSAPALTCMPIGRSYFTPPRDQIVHLGGGMEMYYGFYQSAIVGWRPFLNVDVAHKAFPARQNVVDLILELCDLKTEDLQQQLKPNQMHIVGQFINNLKIRYEIPGKLQTRREYKVNGLDKSASDAEFKFNNGPCITVQQYFKTEKQFNLKFPKMPCIWVGNRERQPKMLLPSELCEILEGQVINRKLTEKQTTTMIKKTATSTEVRKNKIMTSIRKARFNEDPCVREFGICVSDEFEKIKARVLNPPSLTYFNKTFIKPSCGIWRPSKFFAGVNLQQWTILNLNKYVKSNALEEFTKLVLSQSQVLGMTVAVPQRPFSSLFPSEKKTLQELKEIFSTKSTLQLIVVVLPDAGPMYGYVKQAAELTVGCLTQCICGRTISKINTSTVINILQKINAKLEGINHALVERPLFMKRPFMILGADVTHPSPDAKDKPSIAAVTASFDVAAFKYHICWRLQPPKMEIIEDLEKITKEHLHYFYKRLRCKPERIICFRDGVSEGQFTYVLNTEIQAMRRACTSLQADGSYKPAITFLVVQKRHHTRFFPVNVKDIAPNDRNLNVPVGTCVDTDITHPTALDFCLVSHNSIQGVAKPTKYRVLWDDAVMNEDELEQLTFYLCHMFSRCTRSVSYPAPTYYAHLAAARIMAYCDNGKLNMNNLEKEQKRLCIKDAVIEERPMFFV